MKVLLKLALVLAVLAIPIGCPPGTNTEADEHAIRDTEKQWNQDFASKDIDKLALYYAEDAVLMGPGMAPSVGRESVRSTLKQMVADPALSLKFAAAKIDVAESGELAYSRGAYVMTMTDPQTKKVIHDRGSYVTAYRKGADGKWRAVADIASSEIPAGQQSSM